MTNFIKTLVWESFVKHYCAVPNELKAILCPIFPILFYSF